MASSSVTVQFKLNKAAISSLETGIFQGMRNLGSAIMNQAKKNAPVDKGALAASIRVEDNSKDCVIVRAGGSMGGYSVPYARRRHFENKKNPQTLRYLERAFDQEVANYKKYFKGLAK